MANFFSTGGAIDSLFDIVRGELGKADTEIQAWFHDRLTEDTNRYNIQRVLYVYAEGLKAGEYTQFRGYNDPQIPRILGYVQSKVAFDEKFIYNVLFALYESAPTNEACASVLAGSSGNVFDSLMNGGVVNTVTGVVNDTFKGLGFPTLANTVVILGVVGLIGLVVYLKVRK